uniref:Coiled-coil domain-containing protein 146 n=1 Tax=Anas platyrhynchos TaxID=8839 RepID=A0A8B9QRT1_ANAPL
MSQAGEDSSSSDTELEIKEEQPICALAPTVYAQDEGSTDVTASPAFQCLDELFSAGKLSGSKVAELKAKYTLLHETVISLQEEKTLLEKEYERIPKQSEADKRIKKLKENCDELSKEVIQRKAEVNAMKEDILSKQNLMLIDKKEVEKLLENQDNLKDELVKILGVPAQLGKETEKIKWKKIDAEKKKETLNNQIQELNNTLKATEKRMEEILQEREDVMKELDGKQALLESKKQECVALTRLLEIGREKESAILADRELLEYNLKKCILEKKQKHDTLIHKQTLKDRELRKLKKMELQLNVVNESLEQDKSQHKRLKTEAEAIPKSNEVLLERRRELQKEIEMNKRSLAEQEMISDTDARTLDECITEERQLFKEQEKYRNELSRLAHLTLLKVEEKEQKCREVQKAQVKNCISYN